MMAASLLISELRSSLAEGSALIGRDFAETGDGRAAVAERTRLIEDILARLPRRGVPMILKAVRDGPAMPFSIMAMDKRVRRLRLALGLPVTFTLDACRHGGMTELETAELTDGQGRALSGHRTQRAYEGYAKRTLERALPGTRKRYAHRLANVEGTNIQNAPRSDIQNEGAGDDAAIA